MLTMLAAAAPRKMPRGPPHNEDRLGSASQPANPRHADPHLECAPKGRFNQRIPLNALILTSVSSAPSFSTLLR